MSEPTEGSKSLPGLPKWLEKASDALLKGDIAGWMEIYTPDAIHEFPFASGDAPHKLSGYKEINEYMLQLPAKIRFGSFSDVRVHETETEYIIEAKGSHTLVANNEPFNIGYVWFMTMRDGKVCHIRDYMSKLDN